MGDERIERRLAAILAADVVGYSLLVGMDEEGTLAALKALSKSLVDPKITEHRGRIVKNTGDGALGRDYSITSSDCPILLFAINFNGQSKGR
jgi:adenylate cyclase